MHAIPQPSHDNSCRFAETCWNVDQLRMTRTAGVITSQPALVVEGLRVCCCLSEESVEFVVLTPAHNNQPRCALRARIQSQLTPVGRAKKRPTSKFFSIFPIWHKQEQ